MREEEMSIWHKVYALKKWVLFGKKVGNLSLWFSYIGSRLAALFCCVIFKR